MSLNSLLQKLSSMSNKANREGMARYGINVDNAYGIRIPVLRSIAKLHKNNHNLALELWNTGMHEARILASMIDDPRQLTSSQMDEWTADFQSWDLCDQVCGNLFVRNTIFKEKIELYSQSPDEFVKRAGFSLIAAHCTKKNKDPDDEYIKYFDIIEKESGDGRNFVKKAVNWALRAIGKRNKNLCYQALETAKRIRSQDTPSARWIANDAIRELNSKFKPN